MFTERLLQFQLARFWRQYPPNQESVFDPSKAEQRFERFVAEFLETLPPAFALKPDRRWDEQLPRLIMQRNLLHIYIFDSVCRNFRQLLSLQADQVAMLAPYKRVLIQSQKKVLAHAAIRELDAVTALYSHFQGGAASFGPIVFNTFEAAVLLLTLCGQPDLFGDEDNDPARVVGFKVGRISRKQLLDAAEKAHGRLQALTMVNDMAAAGARTLAQLMLCLSQEDESRLSQQSSWASPSLALGGSTIDTAGDAVEIGLIASASDILDSRLDTDWHDLDMLLNADYSAV